MPTAASISASVTSLARIVSPDRPQKHEVDRTAAHLLIHAADLRNLPGVNGLRQPDRQSQPVEQRANPFGGLAVELAPGMSEFVRRGHAERDAFPVA